MSDTVDYPARAAERLKALHEAADPMAALLELLDDSDALLGIRHRGLWAGRIEALLVQLPQRTRGAIQRASSAISKAMPQQRGQPSAGPDPTGGVRALVETHRGDGTSYVQPSLERACVILSRDPRWLDRICRNEHTGQILVDKRPLSEESTLYVVRWLEREYDAEWSKDKVHDALLSVAADHSVHPIREYLLKLAPWDGDDRLSRLMTEYFGAEGDAATRDLYAAYGRNLLVSLVARAMEPGCKVDEVVTLQGRQGLGKSSGLAALMPDSSWFMDDHLSFSDSKRLVMLLRPRWLVEFADFGSIKRADADQVKAFLTQQADRGVPMYGREVDEVPRGCVFVATANDEQFLIESGRRWCVVRIVRAVDRELIKRDRDQLYAQALQLHRAKAEWWLTPALQVEQRAQSARHSVRSPVVDTILSWADAHVPLPSPGAFPLRWLWQQIVLPTIVGEGGGTPPDFGMTDQKQFASALRESGWTQSHGKGGNRWSPPEVAPPVSEEPPF